MIYHLTTLDAWEAALENESYSHPSLLDEGFIHCSTKAQLLESARIHFSDHLELVVIGIVDKRIRSLLKWEEGRNQELFPHIYGVIPMQAVETTDMLLKNSQGIWEWV